MKTLSLMLSLFALTIGAVAAPNAAQAKVKIDIDLNFPFPIPGRPDSLRGELIAQRINQNFQGQNTLALRQILNLGPEFRGRRIEQVILRASTAAGRGEATVFVNGRAATASQQVGTRNGNYLFVLPRMADELGTEIQQLQIELRGNFFVEAVGVRLAGNAPGPILPVKEVIELNQHFVGANRIVLADYINLERFRGYRLDRVILRAQTRAGQGDATLCTTRCQTINNVGTVLQNYSFDGGGVLVDRSRAWSIDLRGNFYVEKIRLEFSRF